LQQEETTWELESSLPKELVDEFERSLGPKESLISECKFGVLNHILVMNSSTEGDSEPHTKRPRNSRDWSEGSVMCFDLGVLTRRVESTCFPVALLQAVTGMTAS
jgi:hypothetical protein